MAANYGQAVSFNNYGTLTTDASTDEVTCRGWTTLSAHLDSGSGTLTWEFKGPDAVWRSIYGGTDGTTVQAFTATHMVNAYFGKNVSIRATGSSGSSPVWDWQIMGDHLNKGM